MNKHLRPNFDGDEAGRCGGCGSRKMSVTSINGDTQYAYCLTCDRLQELETRDWPESTMCDNCAFRAGSPERADPYRWAEIQATLQTGQLFHCHKGLPFDHRKGEFSPPDKAEGRVTVCAGWLAARIAKLKRKEALN